MFGFGGREILAESIESAEGLGVGISRNVPVVLEIRGRRYYDCGAVRPLTDRVPFLASALCLPPSAITFIYVTACSLLGMFSSSGLPGNVVTRSTLSVPLTTSVPATTRCFFCGPRKRDAEIECPLA